MKDIIKMLDEVVSDNAYGSATLTTQGIGGSRFTKTGRPPGIWEDINDLPVSAERILKVFRKVAGTKDPVQTPEFWANVFQNRYGIEFPRNIEKINKEQAIALNKFGNDMEKHIKEMDTKTYAGVDAMTSIKKDPKFNTLQGDAKKDLELKLKGGGAVELEEGLAGVVAIGQKAMKEALESSNYQTIEDADTVFEELKRGAYYVLEDLYNDYAPNAGAAPDEMMEDYMKSRKDSNLMEVMDKHRKRSTLMEGTMRRFFKAFDGGSTDEEMVHEYAKEGITVPEAFVSSARRQWESLKKAKLDLELSEKEAKGFKQIQTTDPTDIMGMEAQSEPKQMASSLFN